MWYKILRKPLITDFGFFVAKKRDGVRADYTKRKNVYR